MATRKFLTSVADVYGYDQSENLLFVGKTLLDSSMEVSLGSAPVRGGRGNQLQYIYYHTGEMKFTLTDTQWNPAFLGATVGSAVATSNNIYGEETISLTSGGGGTVTGTPLAWAGGATIYGWVTQKSGVVERVTFTGSAFATSSGSVSDVVCVRYYKLNAASTSVTVPSNMIPSVVKLVMETQLNSADVSTNKIGIVQIIAPTVTLSGAFTISMKSDGVSNTPLTATALAYTEPAAAGVGCATAPYYAKLIEVLDSANWYDNVIGLSIQGGDFSLATTLGTATLTVWAIPNTGGAAFRPPVAALDFTSGTPAKATAGLHTGLITGVSAGTSLLSVFITAKSTIEASCTVTVP